MACWRIPLCSGEDRERVVREHSECGYHGVPETPYAGHGTEALHFHALWASETTMNQFVVSKCFVK